MNRITEKFSQLRLAGRKGFIPFVTAGDPSLAMSEAVVLKLAELGADVIELGVPFSDPMADGPTIQASSQRALANGVNLPEILSLIGRIRSKSEVPLVLFSYLNPLVSCGIERFAAAADDAGVDGVLITDAVDDEAAAVAETLKRHELELISLVAPTTSDKRLEQIAGRAGGFLYAVSRAGVTGARAEMTSDAEELVTRIHRLSDLPIAVGFGISTSEQILDVWRYADAAVVGSAIVSKIAEAGESNVDEAVESFVKRLVPQFATPQPEI